MKISTRIGLGYAILIAITVAALSYQFARVHEMQLINRDLAGISFRVGTRSVQMSREVALVEEFTQKFFATLGDPGYAAELEKAQSDFSKDVQELKTLPLSAREQRAIEQLDEAWADFTRLARRRDYSFRARNLDHLDFAESARLDALDVVAAHTQKLIAASQQTIAERAEESAVTSRHAGRVSLFAAAVSLALSLLVSFWILRSISKPLRRLTKGTCAVAEGDFNYRLDEGGNNEFSRLAADFNTMTRRLSELDEMKKDFVSHVSHELKSPLASVLETNRLLLEQIPGPLTERQRQLLEVNVRSCQRLSRLIENLLDLARVEAGAMEYEIKAHDFAALARSVLAEFESQVWEKGIRIEAQLPDRPLIIECDAERIAQVLNNLLTNARKFSPNGGVIRLQIGHVGAIPAEMPQSWRGKVREPPAGYAVICVSDSGPGVPAAERERIFEKFHRVKQAKKTTGVGLGLTIGRSIVEAHGGAIWVTDNEPAGSKFYVLLPAKAAALERVARVPSFLSGIG